MLMKIELMHAAAIAALVFSFTLTTGGSVLVYLLRYMNQVQGTGFPR